MLLIIATSYFYIYVIATSFFFIFVQVMSGSSRRDWTPAFPDDHRHDGLKRDSRYYYPRNHLL